MTGRRKRSDSPRFLIFRMQDEKRLRPEPVFLSTGNTWTPMRASAKLGSLPVMKALVEKLKKEFPDLILEKYSD